MIYPSDNFLPRHHSTASNNNPHPRAFVRVLCVKDTNFCSCNDLLRCAADTGSGPLRSVLDSFPQSRPISLGANCFDEVLAVMFTSKP